MLYKLLTTSLIGNKFEIIWSFASLATAIFYWLKRDNYFIYSVIAVDLYSA